MGDLDPLFFGLQQKMRSTDQFLDELTDQFLDKSNPTHSGYSSFSDIVGLTPNVNTTVFFSCPGI